MLPKQLTPKRKASSCPAIDPSDLSDAARRSLVKSDAARKRAAYAFTNVGAPVPPKLLYRAVPEFDRLRAIARSGQGSSSGAGSSSRAMVRRASQPQPQEEEEVEGYDADAFGRSLSSLDFVPGNAVEAVMATLCERSAAEEAELQEQRRRDEELNKVLLDKAIAASLAEPIPVVSSDE